MVTVKSQPVSGRLEDQLPTKVLPCASMAICGHSSKSGSGLSQMWSHSRLPLVSHFTVSTSAPLIGSIFAVSLQTTALPAASTRMWVRPIWALGVPHARVHKSWPAGLYLSRTSLLATVPSGKL